MEIFDRNAIAANLRRCRALLNALVFDIFALTGVQFQFDAVEYLQNEREKKYSIVKLFFSSPLPSFPHNLVFFPTETYIIMFSVCSIHMHAFVFMFMCDWQNVLITNSLQKPYTLYIRTIRRERKRDR